MIVAGSARVSSDSRRGRNEDNRKRFRERKRLMASLRGRARSWCQNVQRSVWAFRPLGRSLNKASTFNGPTEPRPPKNGGSLRGISAAGANDAADTIPPQCLAFKSQRN